MPRERVYALAVINKNAFSLVFITALIGIGLTAGFAGAAQSKNAPISVRIKAVSDIVTKGADLVIETEIRNTSDTSVCLSPYPGAFKLDVRDSEGRAVTEINPARKKVKPDEVEQEGGSYQATQLAPGDSNRFEEVVNKKFDLSKPGKYTIQALQRGCSTTAKSNLITIAVMP